MSLPGPRVAVLPRFIADAIVVQARAEQPNEACGLIVGSDAWTVGGVASRYEACRNRLASPYRYEVHPDDLLRVSVAADDAGEVIWGIVHSHVRSAAVPSPTDIRLAFYPEALHLLVSLAADQSDPATGALSLRAWRILDGVVHEIALEVA